MSPKSIAIPSRRKVGGKLGRVVAADEAVPPPVAPRPRTISAPTRGAPVHRYTAGQLVSVAQPSRFSVPQAGLYRIVRAMPYEGGRLQYRVRGERDSQERVVAEADISLPDDPPSDELP